MRHAIQIKHLEKKAKLGLKRGKIHAILHAREYKIDFFYTNFISQSFLYAHFLLIPVTSSL